MTALEDNREAMLLGQAWRRCEAALPDGCGLTLNRSVSLDGTTTGYSAWVYRFGGNPMVSGLDRLTPTAALDALAEALRG